MISQYQMREWISESLESFKSIMPVIDVPYPEFYIINERNAGKIFTAIDRIESPLKITEIDSVMEVIHGEQNDAIVIQQKGVRAEPNYINDVEISFKHRLYMHWGTFIRCTQNVQEQISIAT